MKIFLDTNIVVDYLAHREGFFEEASIIFELIYRNEVKAFVSSLTIINCAYVMRKFYPKELVHEKLSAILERIHITAIDEDCIITALQSKPYDFEDFVQFLSARKINSDIIITRDKKGFRDVDVKVMAPHDFIQHCKKE